MSMIHQIQVQGPGIHDVIAVEAGSGWAGICEWELHGSTASVDMPSALSTRCR